MYTKKELNAAKRVIAKIARENHVPEAQVRAAVLAAMDTGRRDPDPDVQTRWARFRYAGAEPTVEEVILWLAGLTKQQLDPALGKAAKPAKFHLVPPAR